MEKEQLKLFEIVEMLEFTPDTFSDGTKNKTRWIGRIDEQNYYVIASHIYDRQSYKVPLYFKCYRYPGGVDFSQKNFETFDAARKQCEEDMEKEWKKNS